MSIRVCPCCKKTSNISRRRYPCYVEDYISLYPTKGNSDWGCYNDGMPMESSEERMPEECLCASCGYLYTSIEVRDIYDNEMVEEKK